MTQTTVPGQGLQSIQHDPGQRAGRPRSIPREEWPEDPRNAVPFVLYDEATDLELPRYRATQPCYTEVTTDGGRYIETDQEFYHQGLPAHFMDPVNQAAIDRTMEHPPSEFLDPVEQLPMQFQTA